MTVAGPATSANDERAAAAPNSKKAATKARRSIKLFYAVARAAGATRGLTGAQASPPSGAMMMTLRPPWRFQAIGVRTVIVWPVKSPGSRHLLDRLQL
jgi:hypothetical protein